MMKTTVRECISLHIGQAGCQIGASCWELFCLEQGISPDGNLIKKGQADNCDINKTFFSEVNDQYVPRTIFFDLEPSVIDQIRTSPYKDLYHPNRLINYKEDAANNFARGWYSLGTIMWPVYEEAIRHMTEECESLQGFLPFFSIGGGTGSGFTSLLLQELHELYPKKIKLNFGVFPYANLSTCIVEPYNATLYAHKEMYGSDCTFMLDNKALYNICSTKLGLTSPNYKNLNDIIAQIASSVTASLRYGGTLNVDLIEFPTNLVPFEKLHFPMVSYAPILNSKKAIHQNCSVADITNACVDPNNRLVACDTNQGVYLACCLLYRGMVGHRDINDAVSTLKIKHKLRFADWCPTGIKIGVNSSPPTILPESGISPSNKAVCMLANNSSISSLWQKLRDNFYVMYKKKAFLHWYANEGMEAGEFLDAMNYIDWLGEEYHNTYKS